MIPCVVLASGPKAGADFTHFRNEYYDFCAGTLRSSPYPVQLFEHGDQDGGNGGGGEPGGAPMKASLGEEKRTFWDFKYHPASSDREVRFPPALRFELCLPFQDIGYAAAWLSLHPAGLRLGTLFDYVQIVACSTPAFVGTVLDSRLTDAFSAPGAWIGT